MTKLQTEATQLIATVRHYLSPIIKDSSLLTHFLAILRGSQELRNTCRTNSTPIQGEGTTAKIIDALARTTRVVRAVFPQQGEGHTQSSPIETAAVNETAIAMSQVVIHLKEYEGVITAAADERATIQSLLRRLEKNCRIKTTPKQSTCIRMWWDKTQDGLPEEKDDAERELLVEIENNWDTANWLQTITQCASWYGHDIANT